MTYAAMVRSREAAQRRKQRETKKALRELERRAKELEKLSAIEQARLEVDTYEKRLEVLLSVHKEQGDTWDWIKLASSLAPLPPQPTSFHEFKAKQRALVTPAEQQPTAERSVVAGRDLDRTLSRNASALYARHLTEWEQITSLAKRIVAGDPTAYKEALVELSPLAELVDLGSSIHFTVHTDQLIGCELKVNGKQAIPAEHKAFTATGKVSTKTMPKARFHEIYQEYVCGCILRVAREVFAVLPVSTLLITALADVFDLRSGRTTEQPVLSAVMPRTVVARLAFEHLDPSSALENFQHRGDFKASRNSEAFQPIVPLRPGDLTAGGDGKKMSFRETLAQAKTLRSELQATLLQFRPNASAAAT